MREGLTPRPLTLLSLSPRIQSLSLQALSLREFLSRSCTKNFEQGLISKAWIVFYFLQGVHLFISEGGKGKGHLGEPRDGEGKGHLGMGKGLLELCRRWSQRTSSKISGTTAFNLLKENSLSSTVDRRGCIGRPFRWSTIGSHGCRPTENPFFWSGSIFNCRPLSEPMVDCLGPSINR